MAISKATIIILVWPNSRIIRVLRWDGYRHLLNDIQIIRVNLISAEISRLLIVCFSSKRLLYRHWQVPNPRVHLLPILEHFVFRKYSISFLDRVIGQVLKLLLFYLDFTKVLVYGHQLILLILEKSSLKEAIVVLTVEVNSLRKHSVLLFSDLLHVQVEINQPRLWTVLLDQDWTQYRRSFLQRATKACHQTLPDLRSFWRRWSVMLKWKWLFVLEHLMVMNVLIYAYVTGMTLVLIILTFSVWSHLTWLIVKLLSIKLLGDLRDIVLLKPVCSLSAHV